MTMSRSLIQSLTMLVAVTFFMTGCKDSGESEDIIEPADTVKTTVLNVKGKLFSIPSPIQTAMLIQKSGISYDKAVLSTTNKVNHFSTDFKKALNLGVYGADLGYVSLYNQTQDALAYLGAIKQLSDKLGVSAAFDAATMDRIKNNITNKDSMTVLVGLAYRASNAYLKENQRDEISTLILVGGWIESMHFSMAAYKAKPSDAIKFRLAEQKLSLENLVNILAANESPESQKLNEKMKELSKVYENISFSYNFVEPVTDTLKKITYINSTSVVNVTDEQMKQIQERLEDIRNMVINDAN